MSRAQALDAKFVLGVVPLLMLKETAKEGLLTGLAVMGGALVTTLFFRYARRLFPKELFHFSLILWIAAGSFAAGDLIELPPLLGISVFLMLPDLGAQFESRLFFRTLFARVVIFDVLYLAVIGARTFLWPVWAAGASNPLPLEWMLLGFLLAVIQKLFCAKEIRHA